MAACKPEILLSQLVEEIETPFQGLPLIFGVEQFFWQLRKLSVALEMALISVLSTS